MSGSASKPPERRLPSPRRGRGGLKLKAADGAVAGTWLSRQWLGLLEELLSPKQRREGLEYARRGRTTALEIGPGRIDAAVRAGVSHSHLIQWRLPVLSEEQGQRIIDAMAAEAFYAAKLLAKELPPAVAALFGSHDLRLLPPAGEVALECDCGASGPCPHAAAVGYLVAQRLDEEPGVVFELRGVPQILERISAARALRSRGVAAAHADPLMRSSQRGPPPLEACLESFWRPGRQLAELERTPPPHHATHSLLMRLGPSPLPGRFPLVGLLASIYDTVAHSALSLRDQAERLTGD